MKKGILFLVITSVIMLQSVSFTQANELTDDYFDIATNYFNSNNYLKAKEYLDLIIKIEPDNHDAMALMDKISPPCVATSPTSPTAPTAEKVNEAFQSSGNKPQVDTEKVIFNSDYYNTKGKEFYQKKEYDNALEYFYKALTVDNKNFLAYNNLAMVFWMKNNPHEAIKYFKKANSVDKYYTQPLVNLASVYKQLGDTKSQLHYLLKAIKINPNDYLAYYWLGDYYRCAGQYPQAIENYKESVKINPKFAQAYLNLAICFFETEEFNYTLMALNQYKEICPDSDYAYLLAAKANLALCNYVDAKTNIQKALEINNSRDYQLELAKADYYLGDYDDALGVLEGLLKGNESAEIYNYKGLCNYKLKNIDEAISNFLKTIGLDTSRPIYYYNLAQCYKSIGDKKNYAKYVNAATRITPINYQDFIDLSYIYYDNGSPGYAINSLNNAIAKYPDVKSLYLAKSKIYEAIGDTLHYNETRELIEKRFNKR